MTKHLDNCKRVFSKYDQNCPRCRELIAGDKPRAGWQSSYYAMQVERLRGEKWERCSHGIEHQNPGGYCNICGNGRDFS